MKERTRCKNLENTQESNHRRVRMWPKVTNIQENNKINKSTDDHDDTTARREKTSMNSLITWNISKALEKNPRMDVKSALQRAQREMESRPGAEISAMASQTPEERHLFCALLAWHQLGHRSADSLTEFAESKQNEKHNREDNNDDKENSSGEESGNSTSGDQDYFPTRRFVARQANSKIVMHAHVHTQPTSTRNGYDDYMDTENMKISDIKSTEELGKRAALLASREARRAELLERAETAWRDLELGYERRLRFAEEKEDMLTKQIPLLIKERDSYKTSCNTLVDKLKEVSELVCSDRDDLKVWETKVFDLACLRHSLASDAAQTDAKLQEQQFKATQMDREFQLQLTQVKRKVAGAKGDLEAALLLRQDTEKGFRTELGQLKIQVQEVSKHLLQQDADNSLLKNKLAEIRQQMKIRQEDLETLMQNCDGAVKRQLGQLQKKRRQLVEDQAKAVDCRCKLPVDANVEAKRTPSLAALCRCNVFEGKFPESCSCTSLRSKLLSDLFSELFRGLQEELGGADLMMPCQMLNCLSDNHNWDRASVVKINLNKFFNKLLLGELDIAIATSIEKYHAKWVGTTCEDEGRLCPASSKAHNQTWQTQDVEHRALALAQQFAENLLQKQADILTAKNIEPVSSKTKKVKDGSTVITKSQGTTGLPSMWRSTYTQNNFTQLRIETEPPTKDVLKKADHKKCLAQRAVGPDHRKIGFIKGSESREINNVKVMLNKTNAADQIERFADFNKVKSLVRINQLNSTFMKYERKPAKHNVKNRELASKICNKAGQTYAVNVCFCEDEKYSSNNTQEFCNKSKPSLNKKSEKVILQVPSIKQTKPITQFPLPDKNNQTGKFCNKSCHCFNKKPSTSSIDKLFDTLIKWKYDGFPPLEIKNSNSNGENLSRDEISLMKNIRKEGTYTERKKIQAKNGKNMNVQTKLDSTENYSCTSKNQIMNELNEYLQDTSDGILNEKVAKNQCHVEKRLNSQCTEQSLQTVPVSRSVYMGAINFDKSYCNCVHHGNNSIDQINDCGSKYGFKCINDDVCSCEYANDKIQDFKVIQNSSLPKTQDFRTKNNKNDEFPDNNITLSLQRQTMNNQNRSEEAENIFYVDESFNDCNCNVKFPGVTFSKCNDTTSLYNTCEIALNTVIIPENNTNCTSDTHIITEKKSNENISKKNIFGTKTACQCCNGFEDLKVYLNNVLAIKKLGMIEDKALDVQSFKEMRPVFDKSCVFCEIKDVNQSKDLEINAFALLKEHLREKLEEIKISTKHLPCVIKDDEEKLVQSILCKVRQVISESTKANTCQCKDSLESKGSWERAYALLQEYLKTKIKRVQCYCASPYYENNILDKVCSLIENDFERLRNKNKSSKSVHVAKYKTEIPEKDENCLKRHQQKECGVINIKQKKSSSSEIKMNTNYYASKKVSFGTEAYIYQNMSSQVSRNYFTKTTSCEPIAMSLKSQETQQQNHKEIEAVTKNEKVAFCKSYERVCNEIDLNMKSCKVSQVPYPNTFEKNQKPVQGQDNNDVMIPERLNLIKDDKISSILNAPYVGCTVACSCDPSLGACVCTKSVINNDKIKNIWEDFLPRNYKQHGYIMEKSLTETKEEPMITNTTNIENLSLIKNSPNRINCTASTMATSDDDTLVLKDSKTCNFRIAHNTTDAEFPNEIQKLKQESQSNLENVVGQALLNVPCCPNDCNTSVIMAPDAISKTESHNCDCKMIPICLVKMLVDNIESNLVQSKCVCDSMDYKVCPVHSNITSVCKEN